MKESSQIEFNTNFTNLNLTQIQIELNALLKTMDYGYKNVHVFSLELNWIAKKRSEGLKLSQNGRSRKNAPSPYP
jgi:hypothetical protein